MPTPPHPRINLREPGELIAATPPLLGFRPIDSLVVIAFSGTDDARLRLTVRADLPPPELRHDLADYLLTPLLRVPSCAVTLIVVGGAADPLSLPPHRKLIEVLDDTFREVGIPVIHALWAEAVESGSCWRCYDDPKCAGTVPDPATTPIAAAAEDIGMSTFDSREDMAATIAPDGEESLARRAAMLDRIAGVRDGPDIERSHARATGLLARAIDGRVDPTGLCDEEIVDLALALSEPRIRDGCFASAFTEHAPSAERLWIELTRRMPPPYRAEPACLLAFATYVRGDGAMTGMALERASEAHPGHRLTHLLRCVLDTGLPPEEMRAMVAGSSPQDSAMPAPTGNG